MYYLTADPNIIVRKADGAHIPINSDVADVKEYTLWLSAGGQPDPVTPVESRPHPRFFGNAKLDLFTTNEQLAIVIATMTDPVVKLVYDRLLGAAYWTYEDPETEQGLSLLQDKGLLTAERKAEIVAEMQPAV